MSLTNFTINKQKPLAKGQIEKTFDKGIDVSQEIKKEAFNIKNEYGDISKAHVKAHTRKTKSGKMVQVKEHEDKRHKRIEYHYDMMDKHHDKSNKNEDRYSDIEDKLYNSDRKISKERKKHLSNKLKYHDKKKDYHEEMANFHEDLAMIKSSFLEDIKKIDRKKDKKKFDKIKKNYAKEVAGIKSKMAKETEKIKAHKEQYLSSKKNEKGKEVGATRTLLNLLGSATGGPNPYNKDFYKNVSNVDEEKLNIVLTELKKKGFKLTRKNLNILASGDEEEILKLISKKEFQEPIKKIDKLLNKLYKKYNK